jgi:homoserine O-acetyltransferase
MRHRDSAGNVDNAVLLLHSTGADTTELLKPTFSEPLYGPGEALDLTEFFVIIPDAIGCGRSSKPSDGMRARFPRYGYEDMVAAQHQLVSEKLGIKHLRLVLGLSMGGMHTWLWGERYPEMMDALSPIGALPVETGGRNRLWRHMIVEAIRNDPEWKHGDYEQQPYVLSLLVPINAIMGGNPVNQYKRYPTRAAADAWYEGMIKAAKGRRDANDVLYRLDASSDYDPGPDLEKIKAPLLAVEFADDQVNSPEFEALDRQMPRVKNGHYVIIPASEDTNGEGDDIINAKLWRTHLQKLLRSSTARAASDR